MQITCLGAAGCVTGSCYLVDNGKKYLVDCGLFQGSRQMEALNHQPWGFNPTEIEAMFLTHAHIDHSGRIPQLVRDGFRGKIYTTLPTAELSKILLLDSAHIQQMEAEWQTRKNHRHGGPDVEPLYTEDDAAACADRFETIARDQTLSLDSELKVCFRNAGHILGSSILEMWDGPAEKPFKVVFSGDLGHKNQLILKDPQSIFEADALFVESTYGNRNHRSFDASRQELIEAIHYSYKHQEKVMIPAFAVERTQEVLYILGQLFREKRIPSMPVYLDSPLAIAATEIFRRMPAFYDAEAAAIVDKGQDPFDFPQLILSRKTEDSIAINQTRGSAIIIAGNGMCTAGRIKHHLKHNLWRPGSSLVIVGFQAVGTTGRRIVEGAARVKIFGENIAVKSKLFTIGGFSAHAGQTDLLEWISHFRNPRMEVYVIHGERKVSESFGAMVHERFGYATHVPAIGDTISAVPFAAKAAPAEIREPAWQSRLAAIIQQAEEIKAFWEKSPEAMPQQVLHELEEELAETEEQLRKISSELK